MATFEELKDEFMEWFLATPDEEGRLLSASGATGLIKKEILTWKETESIYLSKLPEEPFSCYIHGSFFYVDKINRVFDHFGKYINKIWLHKTDGKIRCYNCWGHGKDDNDKPCEICDGSGKAWAENHAILVFDLGNCFIAVAGAWDIPEEGEIKAPEATKNTGAAFYI